MPKLDAACTSQVNFTLNAAGVSNAATNHGHTARCGDSTTTGNTFTITSLNTNGSGTYLRGRLRMDFQHPGLAGPFDLHPGRPDRSAQLPGRHGGASVEHSVGA
jgi:hypothetical protein